MFFKWANDKIVSQLNKLNILNLNYMVEYVRNYTYIQL